MKVWELHNPEGDVVALEIPNIGRHRVQRLVERLPGATISRRQKRFQIRSEEDFCGFELQGERFTVSEPWSDNSRYWVGQSPPQSSPQLGTLREFFENVKRFVVV